MTALARALEWFIAPDPRVAAPVHSEHVPLLDLHVFAEEAPAGSGAPARAGAISSLATAASTTDAPPPAASVAPVAPPVAGSAALVAPPVSGSAALPVAPPVSGSAALPVAPP